MRGALDGAGQAPGSGPVDACANAHGAALELVPPAGDQHLRACLLCAVGEAVPPLPGMGGEHREIVVVANQFRQAVGTPNELLQLLECDAAEGLGRVPNLLCALAHLVQMVVAGVRAGRPDRASPAALDALQAARQRLDVAVLKTPLRQALAGEL